MKTFLLIFTVSLSVAACGENKTTKIVRTVSGNASEANGKIDDPMTQDAAKPSAQENATKNSSGYEKPVLQSSVKMDFEDFNGIALLKSNDPNGPQEEAAPGFGLAEYYQVYAFNKNGEREPIIFAKGTVRVQNISVSGKILFISANISDDCNLVAVNLETRSVYCVPDVGSNNGKIVSDSAGEVHYFTGYSDLGAGNQGYSQLLRVRFGEKTEVERLVNEEGHVEQFAVNPLGDTMFEYAPRIHRRARIAKKQGGFVPAGHGEYMNCITEGLGQFTNDFFYLFRNYDMSIVSMHYNNGEYIRTEFISGLRDLLYGPSALDCSLTVHSGNSIYYTSTYGGPHQGDFFPPWVLRISDDKSYGLLKLPEEITVIKKVVAFEGYLAFLVSTTTGQGKVYLYNISQNSFSPLTDAKMGSASILAARGNSLLINSNAAGREVITFVWIDKSRGLQIETVDHGMSGTLSIVNLGLK